MNIITIILALLTLAALLALTYFAATAKMAADLNGRESEALRGEKEEAEGTAKNLYDNLERLRAARNVSWPKPAKRVPANEVKRAFAVDDAAPLWVALHQEIDDWLQGLFDEVSKPPSPQMAEVNRLHLAGGIEEIRELQKHLIELHASAQKRDADLETADEVK